MSHVLQWMQFWALICSRRSPPSSSMYSYTPEVRVGAAVRVRVRVRVGVRVRVRVRVSYDAAQSASFGVVSSKL